MSYIAVKMGLSAAVVAIQLTFILLPRALERFVRDDAFATGLSYANTFSGAFICATGLLHLLPEAVAVLAAARLDALLANALAASFFFLSWMCFHVWVPLLPCCRGRTGHKHSHEVAPSDSEEGAQMADAVVATPPKSARDPTLSVFFTLAIAVHCVFSGFIMGVQDRFNVLLSVFLSLAFHKWAESLAVGTSLAQDRSLSRRAWLALCCVPPASTFLGILLGFAVAAGVASLQIAIGLASAASAGIFIYLGVVDILAPEMQSGNAAVKSAFVMMGLLCSLMFALLFAE